MSSISYTTRFLFSASVTAFAAVTTLTDSNESEVSDGSSVILQAPVSSTSNASLTKEKKKETPDTYGAPPPKQATTVTQDKRR